MSDRTGITSSVELPPVRNALFGYIDHAVSIAANISLVVAFSRCRGVTFLGDYATVVTICSIVGLVFNMGTQILLAREIARKPRLFTGVMGNVLTIRLTVSLPLTLLFSCVTVMLLFPLSSFNLLEKCLLVSYSIGLSLLMLFQQVFFAIQRIKAWMGFHVCFRVLQTLVALALFRFPAMGTATVFWWWNSALLAAIIGMWIYLYIRIAPFRLQFNWRFWRAFLATSIPMTLAGMAQFLNLRLDIVILQLLAGSEEVGLYNSAAQIYLGVTALFAVLINLYWPTFTCQLAVDKARAFRMFVRGMGLFTVLCIIAGLMLLFTGQVIIVVLFGSEFSAAYDPLLFLGIALLFLVLNRVCIYALVSLSEIRYYTRIAWLGLVLNGSGNFLLIPVLGGTGAALMTAVTELFILVMTLKRVCLCFDTEKAGS